MTENMVHNGPPELMAGPGGARVAVAWHDAEGLQSYLNRHGIGSTTHLDPASKESWLELWPGADEGRVRELLAGWKSGL